MGNKYLEKIARFPGIPSAGMVAKLPSVAAAAPARAPGWSKELLAQSHAKRLANKIADIRATKAQSVTR